MEWGQPKQGRQQVNTPSGIPALTCTTAAFTQPNIKKEEWMAVLWTKHFTFQGEK